MAPSPGFLVLYVSLLILLAVAAYQLGQCRPLRRIQEPEAAVAARTPQLVAQRDELAEKPRRLDTKAESLGVL